VNSQRLFRDENVELLELRQQGLFELGDEPSAPLPAEIQDGDDDDLIPVNAAVALPDATQREVTLLGGEAAETRDETPFDGIELLFGKEPAFIVRKGEIEVVTAG
jgi:hypothetical protein